MIFTKKWIVIGGIVLIAAAGGYTYFNPQKSAARFIVVRRGNVIQEVSVTGQVQPAQQVTLAFEKGGTIQNVLVDVGDTVHNTQTLVNLRNDELNAQLAQADAKVEDAKAKLLQYNAAVNVQQALLDEMRKGTRQEEIDIARARVARTNQTLTDARTTLASTEQKASADLAQDYDDALSGMQKSVSLGIGALITATNIQNAHFSSFDQQSAQMASAKANAILVFLGKENAGRMSNDSITQLDGGAKALVAKAREDQTHANIDAALSAMQNAIQQIHTMLDAIPVKTAFTATETSNLATEKTNIAGEIIALSAKQNAIAVQKSTNKKNIAAAEAGVNDAQNALATTQSELTLALAGATAQQISGQEAKLAQAEANALAQNAQIKQAEAHVRTINAQIAKTALRAPFDGIITAQNAKVGEIVSANVALVSMMSGEKFEIKANIPEADVAKISIGARARVTLDAYGSNILFIAEVLAIDPAETVIDGIATYQTTLRFVMEGVAQNRSIKSGMTANIDIISETRENALMIPQRAVTRTNGNEGTVMILRGGVQYETKVVLGLVGSDGNVEAVSGLQEGEKVVIANTK